MSAFGVAAAGVGVSVSALWLVYWRYKDAARPEPRRLVLAAFGLGAASALLALGAFRIAALLGLPATPGETHATAAFFCLVLVGPLEEGAKFAVARASAFRWHAFDEPLDGLVYATAVGLGFAAFENVLYLPYMAPGEALLRTVASPFSHSVFAAVWGLAAAHGMFARRGAARVLWQVGGLALAALLHGAYDLLIVGHGATGAAAALVAVAWFGVAAHARSLLRASHPADDSAPAA